MDKKREAMINALATLEDIFGKEKTDVGAINQLREALAEPEQEPVAWLVTMEMQNGDRKTYTTTGRYKDIESLCDFGKPVPLYTSPQPREWQELSEREYTNCLLAANITESVRMTREVGPYCLTEPTAPANWLYKNISAALRAKNGFPA